MSVSRLNELVPSARSIFGLLSNLEQNRYSDRETFSNAVRQVVATAGNSFDALKALPTGSTSNTIPREKNKKQVQLANDHQPRSNTNIINESKLPCDRINAITAANRLQYLPPPPVSTSTRPKFRSTRSKLEVILPNYPTRKPSPDQLQNCTPELALSNLAELPVELEKRPVDDFWLQVYQQINKIGGPVDLFIDILEGLTTSPAEIKLYSKNFYDSLSVLTKDKDLNDLVGLDALINILKRMSTGAINSVDKLVTAIEADYERLANVINRIKGLDEALAAVDTSYSAIREAIAVEATSTIFSYFIKVINEDTYKTWAEIKAAANENLQGLTSFLTTFPHTIEELKANIPGLTQLISVLEKTSDGSINSVDLFVKQVESNFDYITVLDNEVGQLTNSIDGYHRRHSEANADREIISAVNLAGGPISLLESVLTGTISNIATIKSIATTAHKNLISAISSLTTEPLDSIEQRILGLKPLIDVLKGVMNGAYRTPTDIGNAALAYKEPITIISDAHYNMNDAFEYFESQLEVDWIKQKIGLKLAEPNDAVDFFLAILNGIFMRQPQDNSQVAADARVISSSLIEAIESWTTETLESLQNKISGLPEVFEALNTLANGTATSDMDRFYAIEPFVIKAERLINRNKAQDLLDASEFAKSRFKALSMREEIDILIHRPKGAIELIKTVLMGKSNIAEVKEDALKIYTDLVKLGQSHLPFPGVPELVALLGFFDLLSNDAGFVSEIDLANNFALLLYKIEYVNPQGDGKETLKYYVLRVGIQAVVMSNSGAYMYFARVMQEEITDTATLVSEAQQARVVLTRQIFTLTYETLDTVRTKISGLGPLLDTLNSIQIKSDVTGLDIAHMLNNILPTLRPITTELDRLIEWVEYYLKVHDETT